MRERGVSTAKPEKRRGSPRSAFPNRARPKRGAAQRTRTALIDAGWVLLDRISVGDTLQCLTAAEIAGEAGRSERTFWNHFRDWAEFADALVSDMPRRAAVEPEGEFEPVEAVQQVLAEVRRADVVDVIRMAAQANWDELVEPDELVAFRRQLFLVSRTEAEPRLCDVLASSYYGRFIPLLQAIYEAAGAQTRIAPIPPLTWEQLARTLAALSEGLVTQAMADPQTMNRESFGELQTVVALALLRPAESSEGLSERAAAFADVDNTLREEPSLLEIARQCRGLIDPVEGLDSWTQVSEAVGAPVLELSNRARRLSVLEALAFENQCPFQSEDPQVRCEPTVLAFEGLCRLVRSARRDPACAASLLAERTRPGEDAEVIRKLLPLGPRLAEVLGEQPRLHHDRIINLLLAGALSDTSGSPAEITAVALGSHPSFPVTP